MKAILFCLALAALPALGERRETSVASITLYTQFQQEPPAPVLEAIRNEVEYILAPMNVRLQWRTLSEVSGKEVFSELAVLTFKGRCDVAGLMPLSLHPGALGWTHMTDGAILPFSDIECDRVRNFVQSGLLSLPRDDREEIFGRALGRVVAHELYHIFANTARHGTWGVGKEAYTVQELLSDDFQFEERESRALRSGKTQHADPEIATETR